MTASANFPLFYQDKELVRKNNYNATTISLLFAGDWLKKKLNYEGLSMVDLHHGTRN